MPALHAFYVRPSNPDLCGPIPPALPALNQDGSPILPDMGPCLQDQHLGKSAKAGALVGEQAFSSCTVVHVVLMLPAIMSL